MASTKGINRNNPLTLNHKNMTYDNKKLIKYLRNQVKPKPFTCKNVTESLNNMDNPKDIKTLFKTGLAKRSQHFVSTNSTQKLKKKLIEKINKPNFSKHFDNKAEKRKPLAKRKNVPYDIIEKSYKFSPFYGLGEKDTCFVCGLREVRCVPSKESEHAGHILAHKHGGKINMYNIIIICAPCNKHMSSLHMLEYMEKMGFTLTAGYKKLRLHCSSQPFPFVLDHWDALFGEFDFITKEDIKNIDNTLEKRMEERDLTKDNLFKEIIAKHKNKSNYNIIKNGIEKYKNYKLGKLYNDNFTLNNHTVTLNNHTVTEDEEDDDEYY